MNMYATAMKFRNEIYQKRAMGYANWNWENYVPGPLDNDEWRFITELAGCWCYDNGTDPVRFYTNHNHPMWK